MPTREFSAEQSGVVSRALRNERHEAVREALDSLEPKDREVVLLRGVEQVPAKAAAVVIGVSEEAVSKRFRRALAKLRARLPGSVFDEIVDG
jgi:RNA polymerase sigma factor (sigma-70 family)